MRLLATLFGLLFIAAPAFAETKVVHDIAYGSDKLQALDIYQPSTCASQSCPVVMWVHGGGWSNGDKTVMGGEDGTKIGALWAERGAVVVSINYRLSPNVMHPAHAQDVAAAINWTYKNINSYGGNKDRLYLMGHSAGAHLIALVATDPQFLAVYGLAPARNLAGVFPIDSAAYSLQDDLDTPLVGNRITAAFSDDPAKLQAASPLYNVKSSGSYPPFIIAAAKQHPDGESSMNGFAAALRKAGGSVATIVMDYPGQRGFSAHRSIAEDLFNPASSMTIALMKTVGLRADAAAELPAQSGDSDSHTGRRLLMLRQLRGGN